ncbi:hypothetical protein AAHH78_40460, partial [Burkholderia pseudomallei]
AFAFEYIVDCVARALCGDPLEVGRANVYGKTERNVSPYGQTIEDYVLPELIAVLVATSAYRARRAASRALNAACPVMK